MDWYERIAKRDEKVAKIEQLKSLTRHIDKAIKTLEVCKIVDMASDSNDSVWQFDEQFICDINSRIENVLVECNTVKTDCESRLEHKSNEYEKMCV